MNIKHFGLDRQYNALKDELLNASHLALQTGNLIDGSFTKQFEEWLRNKTGAKYAVTVGSGTQALEFIARYELSLNRSSPFSKYPCTIKLPNFTYPATMNAFITAGWKVELCDTDKYGIFHPTRDDEIACVVGLYGRKIADGYPCRFIVDGAQHWLVANRTYGAGMAISFDPTKNLPSSGNGGAIISDDRGLYDFAVNYRTSGRKITFVDAGTNSKMSEQDCAQILVRTKYLNEWQIRRYQIATYWNDKFKELPFRCLCEAEEPASGIVHVPINHAYQKYVIYTSERNSLHTTLLLDGVESKIHYEYTLGELPIADSIMIAKKPDLLSVSVMLSRGVLSLPFYPELTDIEVEYITDRVRHYFQK